MKSIYIVLTKTGTILARAISSVTGAPYSHSSISFDLGMASLYSFGRRFERNPIIAGIVRESFFYGVFSWDGDIPCAVYELPVTDEVFYTVKDRVTQMYKNRRDYKYNMLGLIQNIKGHARKRPNRYFCSEFIADVLESAGAIKLDKPPELTRPSDFAKNPQLRLIYSGAISGYHRTPRVQPTDVIMR